MLAAYSTRLLPILPICLPACLILCLFVPYCAQTKTNKNKQTNEE